MNLSQWRVASNYLKHNKRLFARQLSNVAIHTLEMRTIPKHSYACPYTIFVEPTIRCNLRCPMCDWEARSRKASDMTLAQFEEILDKLPLVAHMHLEGLGEPLLNKDFIEMARMATQRGVSVDTTTNCTLVAEKIAEDLMSSGLSRLFISIDGATRRTYEAVRVGASFDSVMANLKLLAHKKLISQSPMEMNLWFVGTEDNIYELPRLVELASFLGIPVVYADTTHDWGNEKVSGRIGRGGLWDKLDITKAWVLASMAKAEGLGVSLRINPLLNRVMFDTPRPKVCKWPWWSFYITVEGFVMPCCLRPDPRKFHLGNIFMSSFEDIWNSPEYMQFRSDLKQGIVPDYCKGCEI